MSVKPASELPHTFEKHWNVTFTQTHVPKRHLNTPAVRLRLQPCSVQPLSINPGSSSEIKDLPRQSSQPIVTLLMNPLTWLARLQSARCWLKSKDTKGQRQNHLGSLLGCQNGVPVRDNTVGADNLPLIKRRRRRRRVCRPQGECREGEKTCTEESVGGKDLDLCCRVSSRSCGGDLNLKSDFIDRSAKLFPSYHREGTLKDEPSVLTQ